MAFEDELGHDSSQPMGQNYTLSATGLVSRTLSLWSGRVVQYILIVGVISAACAAVSVALLFAIFGLVGTIGSDPFSYVISFVMDPLSDLPLLAVTTGFAIFAFVLNAIVQSAAIKFTLEEYGGTGGSVGASFSYSFRKQQRQTPRSLLLLPSSVLKN
jgi:hypothetical protein